MKNWIKFFVGGLLAAFATTAALAQQPVISVSITKVDVLVGANTTGFVNSVTLVSGGSGFIPAVGTQLGESIVSFSGGGGTGATATADVTNGAVTAIHITSGGTGYTTVPTVVISGGTPPAATATATLGYVASATFVPPNESFGAVGNAIAISALAVGTFPASGFTYRYFVDGVSIGQASVTPVNSVPAIIAWQPPQPGAYFLTVVATDGLGNSATSLPIRYYATGTVVNSPSTNTSVPTGSSVVLKADATGPGTFIKSIQFFDNGVAIGSDNTLPYSLIYTVPGAPGSVHNITAQATDNNNTVLTASPAVTLNVVNSITPSPTCAISSPANNAAIPIGSSIPIAVDAHSTSGDITKVELYIDGVLFGTATAFPYNFTWTPTVVATYHLVALAYDDKQNVIASAGSPTVVSVAAPPTITVTNPTNGSTITGGASTQITANASDSNVDSSGNPVTITSVQFFVDGTFVGVANTPAPGTSSYSSSFNPIPKAGANGAFLQSTITALAIDSIGISNLSAGVAVNVTGGGNGGTTTVIGQPPIVAVTAPTGGTSVPVGSPVTLSASASDPDGTIVQVQFIANGQTVATISGFPYNATWTPLNLGSYSITAKATDNSGNTVTSTPVVVTVQANGAPSVTLTSPTAGATFAAGTPVTVSASASDFDGSVSSVRFTANGIVIGTVSALPYKVIWTPSAQGTYSIVAQATDNSGNFTVTPAVTVTVGGNQPPVVALTSPSVGTGVAIGSTVTLTATASDPDGVVSSVQFFASGVPIGTAKTTPPYTVAWTPTAEGVYQLTAVATDNAFATTTSSNVAVIVFTATGSTSSSVYTGSYQAGFEAGKVALMAFGGTTVTLIAHSTSTTTAASKTYFFPDMPLDSAGNFSATASGLTVTGVVSGGSATGTITGGPSLLLFIANTPIVPSTSTAFPAAGYFSGNLSGRPASSVAAIVGSDASIMLYLKDGTFVDAGDGKVSSTGTFTVTTAAGNTVSGAIDPVSGFLTATVSGSTSATVTAALASGGIFSDGSLRNLSTRGQVGTGANVLITGFVIGGTAPKNVLIRAIGPTLSTLGISSPLSDPQLQVFNSAGAPVPGASNDNWSGSASDAAKMASVGAFALPVGSKDSVLITSLPAGVYSTQVSGVGGATGIALVEFYDLDSPTPFSTQKVMNVSTRGQVGTGQNLLIAGFVINGTAPKKVLIRAVGPGLVGLGVSGTLADPFLTLQRLVGTTATTVRENDNWETGNDPSLVVAAAAEVGAFPLVSGSKDSVVLATLPPGTYSAQVTGVGSTTGIALVEVYEVP